MIQFIALFSPLLPIIAFLFFCLKERELPLWVIFFYVLASFGLDMFSSSTDWGRLHRIWVWNIFAFVEFGILIFFFHLILSPHKIRKPFYLIIVAYIIVAIAFSRKNGEDFNSIMSAANSVAFLILSILYFIRQLSSVDAEQSLPLPIFSIVAAIMLSVSSTFFLYLISSRLSDAQLEKYWTLNAFANILTNVIFAIAFILNRFQKKIPATESHTPDYNGFPNDR